MALVDILLPLVLLTLTFGLKYGYFRRPNAFDTALAIFELPVDAAFASLAFGTAYVLNNKDAIAFGLIVLLIGLFLTVISIALWRMSHERLIQRKRHSAFLLALVNYIVVGTMLITSLQMIVEGV